MVYCTNCGEEIPEDAYFCHKCGHRTEKGSEEGASYPRLGRYGWHRGEDYRRFVAEETKPLGGAVTADKVFFGVENINGPIQVSTWDKAEYGIELEIKAGGYTEEEAAENLEALKVDLEDQVVEGQQRLTLKFDHPHERRWYSIAIDVTLPEGAETDLDVNSKNGGIALTKLKGGSLEATTKNGGITLGEISAAKIDLKTSNGKVALEDVSSEEIDLRTSNGTITLDDVSAQKVTGKTSNGRIEGNVDSPEASLSTSNGKIDLTLPCKTSGEYEFHSSNGRIYLEVSGEPRVGYDLDLRTSMSRIAVDLPDLEYTRNKKTHKVAKTRGYEDKDAKVTIEAHTSHGKIQVKS